MKKAKADRFGTLRRNFHKKFDRVPKRMVAYVKAVYALLWVHASSDTTDKDREIWETDEIAISFIADCLSISENTVNKAIQHLEDEGKILRIKRGNYKSRGSVYLIRHIPAKDKGQSKTRTG